MSRVRIPSPAPPPSNRGSMTNRLAVARLETLCDAAGINPHDRIDLLLGGPPLADRSLEGLTETDAVVILGGATGDDRRPRELPAALARRLQAHRPSGTADDNGVIAAGRIAVTVAYADGARLRLVPALRTG